MCASGAGSVVVGFNFGVRNKTCVKQDESDVSGSEKLSNKTIFKPISSSPNQKNDTFQTLEVERSGNHGKPLLKCHMSNLRELSTSWRGVTIPNR